jgi:hypothetical protein
MSQTAAASNEMRTTVAHLSGFAGREEGFGIREDSLVARLLDGADADGQRPQVVEHDR